jgi:hypothetical protein
LILKKALELGLYLQRQQPRIVPTQRDIPAIEPEARVTALPPDGAYLALGAPALDVAHAIGHGVVKYGARLGPHVGVARSENNLVRFELGAVAETEAVMGEIDREAKDWWNCLNYCYWREREMERYGSGQGLDL